MLLLLLATSTIAATGKQVSSFRATFSPFAGGPATTSLRRPLVSASFRRSLPNSVATGMTPRTETPNDDGAAPTPNSGSGSSPGFTSYDPDDGTMTTPAKYGLCISAVVPRPVGVLTTVDSSGTVNCAPFSYTSISSHDPPIVTHGLCLSRGQKKDTLKNIEETKEWVFNVLSTDYLEQANQCSAPVPPDQDETQLNQMPTAPGDVVKAPRLLQAKVAMECELYDLKEVHNDDGAHTTTIVMGRVRKFHVRDDVLKLKDGDPAYPLVDLEQLQAVGRAGDVTYWPVGGASPDAVRSIPRPN